MGGNAMKYIVPAGEVVGGAGLTAFGGPMGAMAGIPMMTGGAGSLIGGGVGGSKGAGLGQMAGLAAGGLGEGGFGLAGMGPASGLQSFFGLGGTPEAATTAAGNIALPKMAGEATYADPYMQAMQGAGLQSPGAVEANTAMMQGYQDYFTDPAVKDAVGTLSDKAPSSGLSGVLDSPVVKAIGPAKDVLGAVTGGGGGQQQAPTPTPLRPGPQAPPSPPLQVKPAVPTVPQAQTPQQVMAPGGGGGAPVPSPQGPAPSAGIYDMPSQQLMKLLRLLGGSMQSNLFTGG